MVWKRLVNSSGELSNGLEAFSNSSGVSGNGLEAFSNSSGELNNGLEAFSSSSEVLSNRLEAFSGVPRFAKKLRHEQKYRNKVCRTADF